VGTVVEHGEIRTAALALPEAIEQDHHGMPSFRVRGKVFATLPDPEHAHLMLGAQEAIRVAVAENPDCCAEKWWGQRLACVRVELTAAAPELVIELLTDAYRARAPKTLLRQHDL
jgi:hypothetical protein